MSHWLRSSGSPMALEASPGLYVFPGDPDRAGQAIQSSNSEDLADAVASLDYDSLILDCPPGVEYLERLELVTADVALVASGRSRATI